MDLEYSVVATHVFTASVTRVWKLLPKHRKPAKMPKRIKKHLEMHDLAFGSNYKNSEAFTNDYNIVYEVTMTGQTCILTIRQTNIESQERVEQLKQAWSSYFQYMDAELAKGN